MRGSARVRQLGPSARASRAALLAGTLATALAAVAGPRIGSWAYVVPFLVAAAAGVLVVATRRPLAPVPLLLTAGLVLLVPAYVLWYPAQVHWDLDPGDPGLTDGLFLAAYVCFVLALARRIGRRRGDDRRIEVIDTLIVSVGAGVLLWVLFISPYLHDESMGAAAKGVAISYAMVDLLLAGAVVRMVVQRSIATTGDRLLAGWVVLQLAADLAYAVTRLTGTFSYDQLWIQLYPLAATLLGGALLHPTTHGDERTRAPSRMPSGGRRFAMVVPAALIAPSVITVLGIRDGNDEISVVALLSAVLFGLVLGRVWLLAVDADEHQALLASLRERQQLSDRLSRIQRKISTRAPLQEVLDAITQGAAELVHGDVAALRFVDETDPRFMVMVSSVGVGDDVTEEVLRLPVGAGVGGRAIVENRLVTQDAYRGWDNAIGQFATGGLQCAMATPVHLGDKPIGSLVVATHAADRTYSRAEQEALTSFAEHVSIALNDARSVRAMNEALERAVHQAMHDDLTGLPNRACFYDRVDQALRAAHREASSTAVLLLDLDRFKEINDTLGHRYGDRVLRAVGPRIAPLLRETDTLARLGGDEFCVLLPRVGGIDEAVAVARRITRVLEEPVEVDDLSLVVEASCGVAVAPAHGDTADLLLQRADVAMYVAKAGRSGVVAYDDGLDRNTPDRLALLGELRAGIAADELVLHYQPVIELRSGAVVGVEALVRWQHPRHGLLGPDEFVPLAEETGMIHPLTTWVLDAALDQLRRWTGDDEVPIDDRFTVAINLSTHSLLDESFGTEVRATVDRYGVRPDQLVLEITETTLMADPGRARRVLVDLARSGVHFSIDDFGTGYSSLASLKDLPVHELKIDRSFVRGLESHSGDAVIVRSVIELGHTLGLRTIAEGVEDEGTRAQLRELGCDYAQGFGIASPMAPAELVGWLSTARGYMIHP